MLCINCSKLANFSKQHACINCPRFTEGSVMKFCSYCSETKKICAVCGKPVGSNDLISQQLSEQIEKIHPFYGGGCRTCGGRKH